MPFATSIVPMPSWSTPLGCTKLFLTIVVLAFISACIAIWGWYAAFSISIFSAVLSLLTFIYYMTALSFRPTLYNKWLVLSLETILTLLWFVSLILLAGWTGASSTIPRFYYNFSPYPTPYGFPYDSSVDVSRRSLDRADVLSHSWQPMSILKRQDLAMDRMSVGVHGMDAHYAAQILAGISAGVAGMMFIMHAITLTKFTMNFHTDTHTSNTSSSHHDHSRSHHDEEMQIQQPRSRPSDINATVPMSPSLAAPTPPNTATFPVHTSPTTVIPSSLTEPLNISSLPRDFEPGSDIESQTRKQNDGYFLSPAEATEAGIRPLTPVSKALRAGEEREKKEGEGKTSKDIVRGDGRIEREV